MVGDPKPFPVVQTKFDKRDGQFSPDGKWIAYASDESGRPEAYVQQFSGPGGRSQISTNGGGMARWRRDGKELFYIMNTLAEENASPIIVILNWKAKP